MVGQHPNNNLNTRNICRTIFAIACLPAHCQRYHDEKTTCCGHCKPSSTGTPLNPRAKKDAENAAAPASAATKAAMMQTLPSDPIAASLEALPVQHMKLRKERTDLARQIKNAKKPVQKAEILCPSLDRRRLGGGANDEEGSTLIKNRARCRLRECIFIKCHIHCFLWICWQLKSEPDWNKNGATSEQHRKKRRKNVGTKSKQSWNTSGTQLNRNWNKIGTKLQHY